MPLLVRCSMANKRCTPCWVPSHVHGYLPCPQLSNSSFLCAWRAPACPNTRTTCTSASTLGHSPRQFLARPSHPHIHCCTRFALLPLPRQISRAAIPDRHQGSGGAGGGAGASGRGGGSALPGVVGQRGLYVCRTEGTARWKRRRKVVQCGDTYGTEGNLWKEYRTL